MPRIVTQDEPASSTPGRKPRRQSATVTPRQEPTANPAARQPTYIREWREHRRLSLRQLADRINAGRPDPLISYASLGRIERGIQPYSQDVLEAVADALATDPGALLAAAPGAAPALWDLWARMNDNQRRLAIAILQAIIHAS